MQLIGVGLPKLEAPLPDGFIRKYDAALGHELFDVTITEGKTKIEPDTMTDNLRRETEAFVIGSRWLCFHALILSYHSVVCIACLIKLTIPLEPFPFLRVAFLQLMNTLDLLAVPLVVRIGRGEPSFQDLLGQGL